MDEDWGDDSTPAAQPAGEWVDNGSSYQDNNYGNSGGGRGRGRGRGQGGGEGRAPREGDWSCECGATGIFASRNSCFKCQAPKPEGLESAGFGGGDGRRPPREPREGDWACPAEGCSATNWANKTECFKCSEPRPEGVGGQQRPAREPREGDWACPAEGCSATNWANKTECFKCSEPRPEGVGGQQRPAREPREGDWVCPSESCSATNWANKTECFKCSEPRPEGVGGQRRPPREPREGDWACPAEGCDATNWANKTQCFKCSEPRPEGLGDKRPPREPRPGDWTCPASGCGVTNWSTKTECFKCHEAKPEGLGPAEADGPPRENYIPAELLEGEAIFAERLELYDGAGINFNDYQFIPVKVTDTTGEEVVVKDVETFSSMNLRQLLIENLEKCKYAKPTPIQRAAIPFLLGKRDIMACAQTGSGKTAAFLLPILHNLLAHQGDLSTAGSGPATPEALILAPTRELALQIGKEANTYGSGSILKVRVLYGGTNTMANKQSLRNGCNIAVATPGRLQQLIKEGCLSLERISYFILDEADRMLDMGFMGDVEKIVEGMPGKGVRISGMFSATFPDAIQEIAKKFLENYVFISIGIVGGACKDVQQIFEQLEQKEKREKLLDILKNTPDNDYKVLVFCGTKKGADFLATYLSGKHISSTSIHGDRLQSQRELALQEFTRGKRKVLVATAVAARGLDIPKVSLVVNFDMPAEVEEYVHRIGRTGRVGHEGKAISFFDAAKDGPLVGPLLAILKGAGQKIPDWLENLPCGGDGGFSGFGGSDNRMNNDGVVNGTAGGGDDDWD